MIPKDTIVSLGPKKPTPHPGRTSDEVLDYIFDHDFEAWLDFAGDFGFYFNHDDGTYYREVKE